MESIGVEAHMAWHASPQSTQKRSSPPRFGAFFTKARPFAGSGGSPGDESRQSFVSPDPQTTQRSCQADARASSSVGSDSSQTGRHDAGSPQGMRLIFTTFFTAVPATRSLSTAVDLCSFSAFALALTTSRSSRALSPSLETTDLAGLGAGGSSSSKTSAVAASRKRQASFQYLSPSRLNFKAFNTMSSQSARTSCADRYSPRSALPRMVARSMGWRTTSR
mmetsp:Transcript_4895/g.16659  ORF Transcript_4895/g.16659 Transcript_4895/m.16659 type:complete len:221 (-) Transcript_4895:2044-2706(-)